MENKKVEIGKSRGNQIQGVKAVIENPFPWFSATNNPTMLQSNPASGRAPDRRHPANCTPPR